MAKVLQEDECFVALTHDYLDAKAMMDRVRSPKAGAIVLFAGNVNETPQVTGVNISKVQLATISVESQSKNFNIHPTSHVRFKACSQYARTSTGNIL